MPRERPLPARWGNAEALRHSDGRYRCPWAGLDPLYVAYHDEEWGRPEYDSRALFEKLMLDGFQAGLSWITILRKRENFRAAFVGFHPERLAHWEEKNITPLMSNAGIVRNRAKCEGVIHSARAYLDINSSIGFSNYLWNFVDAKPIINHFSTTADIPSQTPLSEKISKDLKARGFKFCGPTIVYAFMQAVGMVDDHLTNCHCRNEKRPTGKCP